MCLLTFAWRIRPDHPLIFAGNRDERHARATEGARPWRDAPQMIAGRDLEAGGTWVGVSASGRFAVVTNYRDGLNPPKAPRSRGSLTADFLAGDMPPARYLETIRPHAQEYGAFSLLVGDARELHFFSNRGGPEGLVAPGVHGLSNHLLDTPWPKVERSKVRLANLLEQDAVTNEALFRLLADRAPAGEDALPDTGIGRELERQVSPPFVVNSRYGTRCSTLIRLGARGLRLTERRFDQEGRALETVEFNLAGISP